MSVLSRDGLEASPLADLHAIASELSIDGYRRLRKADLVGAILGEPPAPLVTDSENGAADEAPRPTRRRGGRGRARAAEGEDDVGDDEEPAAKPARSRLRSRSGTDDEEPVVKAPRSRSRAGAAEDHEAGDEQGSRRGRSRGGRDEEEHPVEGVVELLDNGSAFLRVAGADEPSDDDVYISAAQVRRCELVSGDRVSGPMRAPRRSERYPSLVRVEAINGAPADEVVGKPFDDLPAAFPSQRIALDADDPTLKAIEWLTPFGHGSRVTIVGGARAGKSEALRRIAGALAGREGVEVSAVLAGVRPEEISEWSDGPLAPVHAVSFAASADAQAQAVERAVDTAKRVAARGGHAIVLIDTLDGLNPPAARRALAAARAIADGGSLTILATSSRPLGGETTVVALDGALAAAGRFPALDLGASGTLRPELLVGEDGARAIQSARTDALAQRGQ